MKKSLIKIFIFTLLLGFFNNSLAFDYSKVCVTNSVFDAKINLVLTRIDKKIENKTYDEKKRIYYKIINLAQSYIDKLEKNSKNKKLIWVLHSIICKVKSRINYNVNSTEDSFLDQLDNLTNDEINKEKLPIIYEIAEFWIKFKIPAEYKDLNFKYEKLNNNKIIFKIWNKNGWTEIWRVVRYDIKDYKKAMECSNSYDKPYYRCEKNYVFWYNKQFYYSFYIAQDPINLENFDYFKNSLKVIDIFFER